MYPVWRDRAENRYCRIAERYQQQILYELTAVARDTDQISLPAFLAEVRRRVPQGTPLVSRAEERDPLGAMITRISSGRHTMEHRVLARLLQGVVEEPNIAATFRVTEVAALSPELLLLFAAFIDDYMSGNYDRATIQSALFFNQISTNAGTKTTLG